MKVRVWAAVAAAVGLLGLGASQAKAVTNGSPDGTQHPYVAYEDNGVSACTGALLSPTVMLTAAHCFSDSISAFGTDTVTGAPLVRVNFAPDLLAQTAAQRTWYMGSYYSDPAFVLGAGGGLPGFDTHDVAIIVFGSDGCVTPARVGTYLCGPVPAATTMNQYAALPTPDLVDSLAMNTPVDLVGYGVQNFLNGGGPCGGPCKKQQGDSASRFYAPTTLITSNNSISDEFIKLHSNKGGTCFGDSGGPNLLGGTNVVLGVNSFVANSICSGNTYSYRVDTTEALTWITTTAAENGGTL